MPNSVYDFFKKIPGHSSEIKDLDCVIANNGDLTELTNIDVIMKSIFNLLTTKRGTYLFDPDYGCDLYKFLFELVDDSTKDDIYQELEMSIRAYESRGKISYDVQFASDMKGFSVNIYVEYLGEKRELTIPVTESLLKTIPE